MSRGYRVAVPQSVAKATASGQDTLSLRVALMPVLAPARMASLLLNALAEAGWSETADGGREREVVAGVVATVDAEATTISVRTLVQREIVARGPNAKAARDNAEDAAARRSSDLNEAAARALAGAEGDVRAAVDAAIQRVYVLALEEKARSLGELTSMERTEGADGTTELVLKVRV